MVRVATAISARAGEDVRELLGGLVDQAGAALDLAGTGLNQRLDVRRSSGRTLRQAAHLDGDNGKALAGLTGASGFDRGIESQKIGLEGDIVDELDDA